LPYLARARGSCVRGWKGGPSVPSESIIEFGGRPSAALLAAMEANLVAHMAYLPSLLLGSTARVDPDLVLVDSGVPSDTFKVVCGAHLDPAVTETMTWSTDSNPRRMDYAPEET
jgi:hypothetical protein